MKPHDLANINGLNHYIGMKEITPEAIPELRFMPWIIGTLMISGVLLAIAGRRKLLWGWLVCFALLGCVGLWDFWRWERDYGTNLDAERAIIVVPGMSYQPPLIGSKQLLNFTATAWPGAGSAALAIAFMGVFAAVATNGRRIHN